MIKTNPLDISKYLKDETDIALFVEASAQEANEANDPSILLEALAIASKAKGMMQVAKDAGVSRESLYKSLSADAKPRYETVVKVLHALGLEITIKPQQKTVSS